MGFDSGYAGMITVTPDAARTAAAIYWLAGDIPRTLSLDGQQVTTDTGITATLGGTLFLAPPEPVFRASEPDRIALDLRAWGALTLSVGSVEILARDVLMTARVSAHLTLDINNGKLSAGIGDDITVETSQITSIGGGPIPDDINKMINGAGAAGGLTTLLRGALAGAGLMLPPVSIPYLSDPAFSSVVTLARLAYRVVDGAFVLGVDSDGPLVVTHGDPAKLTDFHVDHPLSALVSKDLLNPILQTQRQTFADVVKKDDGTLERFAIGLADGYIDVQAVVRKFGGSADIDFHLVPVLTPAGMGPKWVGPVYGGAYTWVQYPASIYLAPVDIVVDVQTDDWVKFASAFGGLITFGAASFVIAGMTQSSRSSAVQTIVDNAKIGLGDSRVFTVTLPGTTGPKVTFSAERVEFHEHGGLVETTIRAAISDGALFGPGNTALLRAAATRGLTWRVRPPQLSDPADPQLRVRWQLRRVDTNEMIFQQDGAAAANLTVTATIDGAALPQKTKFSMSCRVYRVLGDQTEDLFNGHDDVSVSDPIDHTHPYVQWRHEVSVPQVARYPDGTKEWLGEQTILRTSNIHRTDFAGRCRMVEHGTFLFDKQTITQYLDALPFPANQLVANRAQVCDYCFFGGPTRTAVKP
jgi:hypothetical protein